MQLSSSRRTPFLAALFLTLPATLPQEPIRAEQEIDPDEIYADRALLSIDRKYGKPKELGLYLRESDGSTLRIWKGEPYDARALFDRTILICERWENRITWIDLSGQVLFQKSGISRPVDIEMNSDGIIVVVANGTNEVLGVDPEDGRIAWRRGGFHNPFDVELLDDGGLLVADSGNGRVVKLDSAGRVKKVFGGLGFPNTAEQLEGGGILVTNWDGGEIIELDAEGNRVWRAKVGGVLYSSERRPDGVTIVCDGGGGHLIFLDRRGRRIKVESFAPRCVDYETVREL